MRYILAVIAVIASSSAYAATGPATAQLAAPTHAAMVITAAGLWRCDGTACTGTASPSLRAAVAVCTDIASAAGRVVAFTAADYRFSDADLARCNRRVKP